jgi:hypothetical protein
MKPFTKGLLLGFTISGLVVLLVAGPYGEFYRRIGMNAGLKEGKIETIDFLAQYFPKPSHSIMAGTNHFGLKWYGLWIYETNGITTLAVKNEM